MIDTGTNQALESSIFVGSEPEGIAITPDGRFAYVTCGGTNQVWVIDTQTNKVVGQPIPVAGFPPRDPVHSRWEVRLRFEHGIRHGLG